MEGVRLLCKTRHFPAHNEGGPSFRVWYLYVFLFPLILTYLTKKKIEGNFVDSIFKMNAIQKSLEWAILTGLLSVTGCNRKGFPFSRTLKETLPSDILLCLLFILSDTSLIYFPSLLLQ